MYHSTIADALKDIRKELGLLLHPVMDQTGYIISIDPSLSLTILVFNLHATTSLLTATHLLL
jgi:hypothetical protein